MWLWLWAEGGGCELFVGTGGVCFCEGFREGFEKLEEDISGAWARHGITLRFDGVH